MNEDFLTCVSTFSSEWNADMARMTLETNGIDSVIFKDDCGGMRPFMQPVTGVKLMVKNSKAQRASKILEGLNKKQDD